MPGSNPRALEKARGLRADALILDLEDAVGPEDKALARERVGAALAAGGYGSREIVVRVNGLGTPWGAQDVAWVGRQPVDGVLFPKVESPGDVAGALAALDRAGGERLPVWVMAETPRGILAIDAIAGASGRLACIVAGTSDLAKEMRVPHTAARLGFLVPLSRCVLAARANGLDVLDGVHLELGDAEGFEAMCRQGRELGFDGKTLIHPSQIEPANRVFAPSADEIARARAVLGAWHTARGAGEGVAVLEGRLVESLHAEEAERILDLAEAIAARG
jgi:citrate lyase subunit beta/citryl-CoA lyase